jgi:heat shock protein HslJ
MARHRLGSAAAFIGTATAALLLAAAVPAPAFASVSAGDASPTSSPVGSWRTSTEGVKQTVTFTRDGRVFGDSGCNRFVGGYTVKGKHMTVGALASTLMACPQPQMDAEQQFLAALGSARTFATAPGKLTIHTTSHTLRLTKTRLSR